MTSPSYAGVRTTRAKKISFKIIGAKLTNFKIIGSKMIRATKPDTKITDAKKIVTNATLDQLMPQNN